MSESNQFKVGIFVIVSTALGFGGVIALGSGKLFVQKATIETTTTGSVDGLKVGSTVKYKGVPVGEVSEITFVASVYEDQTKVLDGSVGATGRGGDGSGADDASHVPTFDFSSPVLIRMEIRLDQFRKQAPYFRGNIDSGVQQGLRIRLRKGFVPPDMHVELDLVSAVELDKIAGGRDTMPPYPAHNVPEHPYIPTIPTSDFDSLLDGAQNFLAKVGAVDFDQLGRRAQSALTGIDVLVNERADPMIDEVKQFVAEVRQTNLRLQGILDRPEIDETIENVGVLSADLRGVVADSKDDLADAVREVPRMVQSITTAADRLEALVDSPEVVKSLKNISDASDELKPLLVEYRALGEDVSDLVASEESEIRRLISALRQMAQNLEAVTDRLRQDPPHILFGSPPAKVAPGTPAR